MNLNLCVSIILISVLIVGVVLIERSPRVLEGNYDLRKAGQLGSWGWGIFITALTGVVLHVSIFFYFVNIP